MEMPEKVRSSAGYNSGEAYYRADEMDAYLADRDDDLRDKVAKAALTVCMTEGGSASASVARAFDIADLWMSERARRREGR